MADFAALPLFTDALIADTQHLDDEEFGRYMRLLIVTWRSPQCRIPNDKQWLAKRLRLSPLQYDTLVQPLINEFFSADADADANASQWLTQKRLKKEWKYTHEKREKNRSAAKSRWENEKELCKRISKRNAPSPSPSPTKDITNVISAQELQMLFETIWLAYPGRGKNGATGNGYKGSKAAALKSFTAIIAKTRKEDHAAIIRNITEGAGRYAGHLDRSGYPSKHASTWLNQRGWEDDYASAGGPRTAGSKHDRARAVLLGGDEAIVEG